MVYVNEHFYGPSGFLFGDIAIVQLQNRVSFSSFVAPVCVDWKGKHNEHDGDVGKVGL